MKNVPNWPLFVIIYFLLVGVPVYMVHTKLKTRALANRTFTNLFIYFAGVLASAFLLHSLCMWLYFRFFFQR